MSKSLRVWEFSRSSRLGANAALTALTVSLALLSAPPSAGADASPTQGAQGRQGGGAGGGNGGGAGGAGGQAPKPFLSFYCAGTDSYLKNPKDKWLLDAVQRIEAGGVQLPPELDRQFSSDPQARALTMLLRDVLTTRIAGTMAISPPAGGGPPMPEGQFTFLGNARRPGTSLAPGFIDAMRHGGVWNEFHADPSNASLSTMQIPQGPKVWFGTLGDSKSGATVLSLGRAPVVESMNFDRFGVPKGVEPQFALEVDFGPLQPYLGMASTMLPQGPDGRGVLEQIGLVSSTPMIFRIAGTGDGTESRIEMRVVNGAKAMHYSEGQRALALDASDLQWLPADSVSAWVGKMDLREMLTTMIDQYNAQAEAFGMDEDSDFEGKDGDHGMGADGKDGDHGMGADGKGGAGGQGGAGGAAAGAGANEGMIDRWVHQHLGLDLRRDLLAPLGTTMAVQSSASLGGGFFGSAFIITLRDSDTMKRTLARLATVLQDFQEPRQAGFGLRARSQPGLDALYSLSFAGLPIPIQLSIGIGNGALVMGLSPQTVIAAVEQAKAKSSLADHPGFKMMNGASAMKGANSLGWYDSPAAIKGGYGVLLALANAADGVLLPQSGNPTPFTATVPALGELMKGAKPALSVGRFDGDDMAWTFRCDGSVSVQIAAMSNYLSGGSVATAALAAGLLLPALAKAQDAAQRARHEADMSRAEFEHAKHAEQHEADAHAEPAAGGIDARTGAALRQVGMACHAWAADNGDRFPRDFDTIVNAGLLHEAPRNSRRQAGLTGRFVLMTPESPLPKIQHPDRVAIAWEGYERWPQGGIAVLFADGHVAMVDEEDEFETLLPTRGAER